MAGSRLEKFGSIFTRIQGLLRSGAMKDVDKPVWYEVYNRFPPKRDPVYGRAEPQEEIRSLLYADDVVRSRFYKEFGRSVNSVSGAISLSDYNSAAPLISERFIEKYNSLKGQYSHTDDEVFMKTVEAMKREGFALKTEEEIRKNEAKRLIKDEMVKKSDITERRAMEKKKYRPLTAADLFGEDVTKQTDEDFVDEEFLDFMDTDPDDSSDKPLK